MKERCLAAWPTGGNERQRNGERRPRLIEAKSEEAGKDEGEAEDLNAFVKASATSATRRVILRHNAPRDNRRAPQEKVVRAKEKEKVKTRAKVKGKPQHR